MSSRTVRPSTHAFTLSLFDLVGTESAVTAAAPPAEAPTRAAMPAVPRHTSPALPIPVPAVPPVALVGPPTLTGREVVGTLLADAHGHLWIVTRAPADLPTPTGTRCEPADIEAREVPRVRALLALRDTARALVSGERENADPLHLEALRATLNAQYDAFVAQFGPLNAPRPGARTPFPNLAGFLQDPDAPLVAALEIVDEDHATYEKAPIFVQRIVAPLTTPVITCADDALAVSLNRFARVDLPFIAGLLECTDADAAAALTGRIYEDPATGQWETADAYCSGPVAEKLARAERLAALSPLYAPHVEALRAALPTPVRTEEIDVVLGAPWLPMTVVEEFVRMLLRPTGAITVARVAVVDTWQLTLATRSDRQSALATQRFGTSRCDAYRLIEHALNGTTPTITTNHRCDTAATLAASHKLQTIQAEFRRWVWRDQSRAATLTALYNGRFNQTRPRAFSGAHLTMPGTTTTFTFRPHQKDGVWRAIVSDNVLLGHEVGTGKSAIMYGTIMEWRRLGRATRPLLAVPNVLLSQTVRDFATLYPSARLLVVWPDAGRAAVERTLASALTGVWDCLIVPHSILPRLTLSPDTRARLVAAREAALAETLQNVEARHFRVRDSIERELAHLRGVREGRAAHHALPMTLDMLGIDALVVDECHNFKGLTVGGDRDSHRGGSAAASMLAMQIGYVHQQTQGRNVVLATGTAFHNHVADIFVWQTMLQPQTLAALGIHTYRAWVQQFGLRSTKFEFRADERHGYVTKLRGFRNAPELRAILAGVADFKWLSDLNLPVPHLEGGVQTIVTEPSPAKRRWMRRMITQHLGRRGGLLTISGLSRRATVSFRLVDPTAPREDGKLRAVADRTFAVWQETAAERGTQLIFIDTATPASGSDDNPYEWLRQMWIDRGVPAHEIAFAQDAKTARDRRRLIKAINEGKIRLAIGSTELFGVGTNAQQRLKMITEVDVPWRTGDVRQRHGRILRQGNMWQSVRIERHVEQGSFDAFQYQVLETKLEAERGLRDGGERTLDFGDENDLSLGMAKALATGDPRVMEKARLETRVMELRRAEREWFAAQQDAHMRLAALPAEIAAVSLAQEQCTAILAQRGPTPSWTADGPCTEAVILDMLARLARPDGTTFTDADEATAHIVHALDRAWWRDEHTPVVQFDGLPVFAVSNPRDFHHCWLWAAPDSPMAHRPRYSQLAVMTPLDRRRCSTAGVFAGLQPLWWAAEATHSRLGDRAERNTRDLETLQQMTAVEATCPYTADLDAAREALAAIDAALEAAGTAQDADA